LDCLQLTQPEAYTKLVEKSDAINKSVGQVPPWEPQKKVKLADIIACLALREQCTLAEIVETVFNISATDMSWKASKQVIQSRLESKNAARVVGGIFERVAGLRGVWKLTSEKQAAMEKEKAIAVIKKTEVDASK